MAENWSTIELGGGGMSNVLVLRTCAADLTSYGRFQWPESGPAECPDWDPTPECGHGLHGLLWGEGDGTCLDWSSADAKWLVVSVDESSIVDLGGKVKFPRGTVVYCGDRVGSTNYIAANGGAGRKITGHTATAGDWGIATAGNWGTATAGDGGTATAGDRGTATAGYRGTATAGDRGTATAGNWGTATAGDWGTATAGYRGIATAGDWGTATAGDWGTATAGDRGTATAGDWGTATAGEWGTATAGDRGTATAGDGGSIVIRWWDAERAGYRLRAGLIGEDGLRPNTPYRLNDAHEFEAVLQKEVAEDRDSEEDDDERPHA
jgi:hypothetical protein